MHGYDDLLSIIISIVLSLLSVFLAELLDLRSSEPQKIPHLLI